MECEEPPAKLPRLEASQSELVSTDSSQAVEEEEKKLLGLGNHHLSPPPLPEGWVSVPHVSGALVYLHRPTRVVTLSRPYHVSTSSTIKKHPVLVHGIPCLEKWLFSEERTDLAKEWHREAQGKMGPLKRIAPDRLKAYLALRWDSAALSEQQPQMKQISSTEKMIKREGTGERGRGEGEVGEGGGGEGGGEGGGGGGGGGGREGKNRQQPKKKQQQPLVPEGLSKVISVKIPSEYRKMVEHPEGKKPPAVWEVNTSNKNPIALLYEFCQLYFHIQPEFTVKECCNQHTPFWCTVAVGGIRYGSGGGTSKKMARQTAASQTLDLFLPGVFSDKLPVTGSSSSSAATSQEGLEFLSLVPIEDPQAPPILAQAGFPSPWQTLKEAIQWNQGLLTSTLTSEIVPLSDTISVPPGHQFEYVLHCGRGGGGGEGWEVRVTCAGKKDGQTAAAQAMLKKLHPYITNWGALLKLYSHPPPSEAPPLPLSSEEEGSGLLSHTDQQLLHQLRHEMRRMAGQQQSWERPTEETRLTTDFRRKHIDLTH